MTVTMEHKLRQVAAGADFKLLDDGAGSLTGYASTFGGAPDSDGDVVVKGAFSATLPTFLRDGFVPVGHDWYGLPVATVSEAYEDDYGLFVKADFHSTPEAQAARTVIRERLERGKTVGLSIGYSVPPGGAKQRPDGVRELTQLELFEFSIVTVPANARALATSAKTRTHDGVMTLTDVHILMDGVPVSKGQMLQYLTRRGEETKGAIRSHSTATSDGTWDSGANERRLPNTEAALRAAFAWVDPDGDPTTKSAYKFIHHEVDADGNVGPANLTACSTGIGVLNGGRGTDVSAQPWAKDRDGIYAHVKRHLVDGGQDPDEIAPLKSLDDDTTEEKTGKRLVEEAEQALAAMQSFLQRVDSLAERRALDRTGKAGRILSERNRTRLAGHLDTLRQMADELETLLAETAPPSADDGKGLISLAQRMELERLRAQMLGVPI